VRSNGKELRTKYGLLTRSTTAIPMHRIQLLSVRERPLHRLFGRVEVQADTAGGNPAEEARRRRPRLAPLLRRDRLRRFVGDVQPGLDPDAVVWRPVHPRAGRRILKKSILLALAATAAAILPAGPWGALVLPPLLALAVVNARLQPPRMGWAATGEAVFWRCGWLWRRLILARTAKIQALSVSRSPFDRRWGMATLHVDTAGGRPGGERLRIRYLDAEAAAHLLDDLTARAAATAFRW
jgi:putative membrane protein